MKDYIKFYGRRIKVKDIEKIGQIDKKVYILERRKGYLYYSYSELYPDTGKAMARVVKLCNKINKRLGE